MAQVMDGCLTMLDRRHPSRLIEHIENEKIIMRLHEMPVVGLDTLKFNKANAVVFGEVYDDLESGLVRVTVTFEMFTGVIWKIKSGSLRRVDRNNLETRELLMKKLAKKICPKFGWMSFRKYLERRKTHPIEIGLGFGFRTGNQITLGNIPKEVRTVPPHPDDVMYRLGDILDPNDPNNYLIIESEARVDLPDRKSLDLHVSMYGIVHVALSTSSIGTSEEVLDQNLFRKQYIREYVEGDPRGSALIFYSVRASSRKYLSGNSFSVPIYVTYPVFFLRRDNDLFVRILAGTNLLFPEKISIEAVRGWDRFNELEIKDIVDVGEIKEIEWFAGIDIVGTIAKNTRLGLELTLVYADYQINATTPVSLDLDNNVRPSVRLSISNMIPIGR